MSLKLKVIGIRFLKTFVAGFVGVAGAVGAVQLVGIETWAALSSAVQAIFLAGVTGGIAAVLMAGDKLVRWEK